MRKQNTIRAKKHYLKLYTMGHEPGHLDPMPPSFERVATFLVSIILAIVGALLVLIGINLLKQSNVIRTIEKAGNQEGHLN